MLQRRHRLLFLPYLFCLLLRRLFFSSLLTFSFPVLLTLSLIFAPSPCLSHSSVHLLTLSPILLLYLCLSHSIHPFIYSLSSIPNIHNLTYTYIPRTNTLNLNQKTHVQRRSKSFATKKKWAIFFIFLFGGRGKVDYQCVEPPLFLRISWILLDMPSMSLSR